MQAPATSEVTLPGETLGTRDDRLTSSTFWGDTPLPLAISNQKLNIINYQLSIINYQFKKLCLKP